MNWLFDPSRETRKRIRAWQRDSRRRALDTDQTPRARAQQPAAPLAPVAPVIMAPASDAALNGVSGLVGHDEDRGGILRAALLAPAVGLAVTVLARAVRWVLE